MKKEKAMLIAPKIMNMQVSKEVEYQPTAWANRVGSSGRIIDRRIDRPE
jgi:hypothetical protein